MSGFSLSNILKLLEKANEKGVSISFADDELSVHVQKGTQIDRELLNELKDNKPSLIYYFQQFASNPDGASSRAPIARFDRDRMTQVPLSFSQERLWFIDQLEGSVQYHLPTVLRLQGDLNVDALNRSFQSIINRHEVLRTIIREDNGNGYQYVTEENRFQISFFEGSEYGERKLRDAFVEKLIRKPFDLSRDPMLRADLIRLEQNDYILVVTMHHIASDAWSTAVLVREVVELYSSYAENRTPRLHPLHIQYADYAVWQRDYLRGEVLEKKIHYWKNKLDGAATLQLPTDFPRPAFQNSQGANAEFTIDKTLLHQLQKLSKQQGATLFMTLLAAFKVLLHRYTSQDDICVGTSMASRQHKELEDLIGFFVNTLTLRSSLDSKTSFTQLLQQVRTTTLQAYENLDVPFEKVVEAVVKERDPSRNPLFQVMLVLANTPEVPALRLAGIQLFKENYDSNISKFDLTFFMTETSAGMHGLIQYRTDLFKEETIVRMMEHYSELLSAIVKSPSQAIGLLPMVTEAEKQQLLQGFNESVVDYPKGKTIVDLFEEQAAKTPDEIAVVFEEEQLTYQQLSKRSNQLAHFLKSRGVKEDSLVPICVERSHHMLLGILGILKAGGAYVPIEPDFPLDRKDFILQDTQASLVVSTEQSSSTLPADSDLFVIEIDDLFSAVRTQSTHNPSSGLRPHHLAYVIYTSGSTGRPKGVMIEHGNLVDYVFGLRESIQIDQCRSYALVSSIATDLGNTVIYSSLVFGGRLHVFSKESVSNIDYLHRYFAEHAIDCLKIVPSHWKALSAPGRPLLPSRMLVFGGEALQSELIEKIRQSNAACRIINHYGPTETTIGKLLHIVDPDRTYNKTIPIGKPFSNGGVYIL